MLMDIVHKAHGDETMCLTNVRVIVKVPSRAQLVWHGAWCQQVGVDLIHVSKGAVRCSSCTTHSTAFTTRWAASCSFCAVDKQQRGDAHPVKARAEPGDVGSACYNGNDAGAVAREPAPAATSRQERDPRTFQLVGPQ